MATLRSLQFFEITDLTGIQNKKMGDRSAFQTLTVAGEVYQTASIVADDYQEENLWTASGNIATFLVGIIETDKDILIRLKNGAAISLFECKAGTRTVFGGTMVAESPLNFAGDGVANTALDIIQIDVKRNVADAVGDAFVSLALVL